MVKVSVRRPTPAHLNPAEFRRIDNTTADQSGDDEHPNPRKHISATEQKLDEFMN
jgi:hypothetical protein